MSQNALVLPTTGTVSGLAMTQATNAALDSLNTLNSGATAPTSAEPGSLWHNTSNNTINILSLDTTTWIPLFNINEGPYLSTSFYSNSVIGNMRNLAISWVSNTTANVVADEVTVETVLGGFGFKISGFVVTFNAATNGANGLDTGSLAANSFYSLYAIYNPTTKTAAVLGCLSSTSSGSLYGGTNMPAGYVMSALIGFMATNGSSHFVVTNQLDREVFFQTPVSILSGVTGQAGLTAQSIAGGVPPTAKTVSGFLSYGGTGANALAVAADSTGTGMQQGSVTGGTIASFTGVLNFRSLMIFASQTIYWKTGGTSASSSNLTVSSFTF